MGTSAAWTPERRAKQAEAIRRWQPWTNSTGPRTDGGKKRSSRNAERAAIPPEIEDLIERSRLHADFMQYLVLLVGKRPISGVPAEQTGLRKLERLQVSLAKRGAFSREFLASVGAENLSTFLGSQNARADL